MLLPARANAGTATCIEKIPSLGGSAKVDFSTLMSGPTIVGIHFGAGAWTNGIAWVPARNGRPGGGTAFYKFDAGTSLDTFGLALSSSSGAAIFQTTPVPEPGTYALMIAGLAAVGFIARRRKAA